MAGDDDKIVPIHGGTIPGRPDLEMVRALEQMLADAKAGRLIAFGYACVREDKEQATGWFGIAGTRHILGTTIAILNHRYVQAAMQKE